MIDLKAVDQLKRASVEERLRIIEIILQSLKNDIRQKPEKKRPKGQTKRFKVREFKLGEEVHVDRDELYSERA